MAVAEGLQRTKSIQDTATENKNHGGQRSQKMARVAQKSAAINPLWTVDYAEVISLSLPCSSAHSQVSTGDLMRDMG